MAGNIEMRGTWQGFSDAEIRSLKQVEEKKTAQSSGSGDHVRSQRRTYTTAAPASAPLQPASGPRGRGLINSARSGPPGARKSGKQNENKSGVSEEDYVQSTANVVANDDSRMHLEQSVAHDTQPGEREGEGEGEGEREGKKESKDVSPTHSNSMELKDRL